MSRKLTKEQKQYIKEHINDYPRKDVAKKIGIKIMTLYKYIRIYGGSIKKNNVYERREKIKSLYPTMTSSEIAEKLGMNKSTVQWYASTMKLKHDKATLDRITNERRLSIRKCHSREHFKENGRKLHLKHKMEELRVMSGKPQLTKLRIKTLPAKSLNAKMYLKKRYNYCYSKDEPFTLLFDNETRRCKREQYYTEKFGFCFVEVPQEKAPMAI